MSAGKGQATAPFLFLSRDAALAALVLTAGGLLFAPGLSGPFLLDDGPNLTHASLFLKGTQVCTQIDPLALFSPSGPLGRPVAMLSFALNHCISGLDPLPFKLTNLLLHLICGLLVYVFTTLLCACPRMASRLEGAAVRAHLPLLVALGWLLMPMHVSSVLYVVQRMAVLATLFMLAGLCAYLAGRLAIMRGERKSGVSLLFLSAMVFLPLAALSKENGLLLLPLCLVVEFACFDECHRTRISPRVTWWLSSGALVTSVGLMLTGWQSLTHWLDSLYAFRDFTLAERLVTEWVVLLWYGRMTLLPDVPGMGIFHDDFPVLSLGRDPWVALAGLFWFALATWAIVWRRRSPWLMAGIGIFLVGHAMEASILPLELVFEHRNHFPAVGILIATIVGLSRLMARMPHLFLAVMCAWLGATGIACALRAEGWGDIVELHEREHRNHPGSVRAVTSLAGLFHDAYRETGEPLAAIEALQHFDEALQMEPRSVPALLGRLMVLAELGEDTSVALDRARFRLAQPGLHPTVASLLGSLMQGTLEGHMQIDGIAVASLAGTVLDNPTALPATRADVATRLALFYVNGLRDFAGALRILDLVSEEIGDPFTLELLRYRLHAAAGEPLQVERLRSLELLAEEGRSPWARAMRRSMVARIHEGSSSPQQGAP